MVMLNFYVDPKRLKQFQAACKANGETQSTVLRQLIAAYVARERRRRLAEQRLRVQVDSPVAPAARRAVANADED